LAISFSGENLWLTLIRNVDHVTNDGSFLIRVYGICLCALLIALNTGTHVPEQTGAIWSSYQVGAWGDYASRGNLGVRVEIRSNVYPISGDSIRSDSFWVGSNLANGAFIQFGYELLPHNQTCSSSDADVNLTLLGCVIVRLFWEYWPNATGTTYIGASIRIQNVGPGPPTYDVNGTWHSYEIAPGPDGDAWFFKFDGNFITMAKFKPVQSKSDVYAVAEQVTANPPGKLGLVEFRNMSYLKSDGWHQVESLTALISCTTLPSFGQCSIPNPYGVSAIGPNHFLAGLGTHGQPDGHVLWPTVQQGIQQEIIQPGIPLGISVVGAMIVLIIAVSSRRKSKTQSAPRIPKLTYCTSCGAKSEPSASFCTNCGAKLTT
jgi:hypothetical protein